MRHQSGRERECPPAHGGLHEQLLAAESAKQGADRVLAELESALARRKARDAAAAALAAAEAECSRVQGLFDRRDRNVAAMAVAGERVSELEKARVEAQAAAREPSTSEATRPLAKLSAPSMPELQLALVLVTFLLAIATFWMAYESRKHIRLTRAQYLADRTPLITPRVERCQRSRDVLSTTLVVQNTGTGTIIIHGADIHSQNHRHPESSSIAPGRPYRIAVVTLHPRYEVRFDLTLPVSDDDLAGGEEDIGIWTVHVHLSIRGFPESLETWTVFAFIRYVEGQFQIKLRTFGPTLDDRTTYQRLQGWFKRLPLRRTVARPGRWKRQPTSLDIFGPGAGDVTPRG